MATDKMPVEEQAISWTIRARDADFDDWDALTAWLEADALHAEAFERMTVLDDIMPQLVPPAPAARPHRVEVSPARRWSFARLGAVAAAILAVVTLSFFSLQSSQYSIETGAGERRTIALADGSRIDLNGDTKVTLNKDDPRSAVLDRGEALFTIVHNEQAPFTVNVGDSVVRDAGTIFNIIRADGDIEVGVSEGLVIYNPEKERLALNPGQAVRDKAGTAGAETFILPTSAVGGWHRNQLTYNGATLDRVAADLSRYLGKVVAASELVGDRRFTGTINLTKDGDRLLNEAAPVLGVRANAQHNGWILVEGSETGR